MTLILLQMAVICWFSLFLAVPVAAFFGLAYLLALATENMLYAGAMLVTAPVITSRQ